jgi:hypothetical protein
MITPNNHSDIPRGAKNGANSTAQLSARCPHSVRTIDHMIGPGGEEYPGQNNAWRIEQRYREQVKAYSRAVRGHDRLGLGPGGEGGHAAQMEWLREKCAEIELEEIANSNRPRVVRASDRPSKEPLGRRIVRAVAALVDPELEI